VPANGIAAAAAPAISQQLPRRSSSEPLAQTIRSQRDRNHQRAAEKREGGAQVRSQDPEIGPPASDHRADQKEPASGELDEKRDRRSERVDVAAADSAEPCQLEHGEVAREQPERRADGTPALLAVTGCAARLVGEEIGQDGERRLAGREREREPDDRQDASRPPPGLAPAHMGREGDRAERTGDDDVARRVPEEAPVDAGDGEDDQRERPDGPRERAP